MKKQEFTRPTNDSLIVIPCKIEENPLALALDTGASHTTVDLTPLFMSGYELKDAINTEQIETASGIIDAYIFKVKSFTENPDKATAEKFFTFLGILILFQLNAESLGLLFGVLCSSPVYGIVFLSLIMIVMLSLAGFLTYTMPIYYKWIMHSNILNFALSALISNEFDGLYLDSGNGVMVPAIDYLPPLSKPVRSIGKNAAILVGTLFLQRLLILFICILQNKKDALEWIALKFKLPIHSLYSSVKQDSVDSKGIELSV